jgi:hypothetical protein
VTDAKCGLITALEPLRSLRVSPYPREMEFTTMTSLKILSTAAALALLVAAPSASFAQQGQKGGGHAAGGATIGGGGGARMGGGAPAARFGGGAPQANARIGGGAPQTNARIGGGAPQGNFAANAQSGSFAAGRPAGGATWSGGRTTWNGGDRGWRGGDRRRGGWWPGAVAAGAVVGGAIAANDAYAYYGGPGYYDVPGYYDDQYADQGVVAEVPVPVGDDSASYCAQRYRSYDPASGTYLGFDGLRHACP